MNSGCCDLVNLWIYDMITRKSCANRLTPKAGSDPLFFWVFLEPASVGQPLWNRPEMMICICPLRVRLIIFLGTQGKDQTRFRQTSQAHKEMIKWSCFPIAFLLPGMIIRQHEEAELDCMRLHGTVLNFSITYCNTTFYLLSHKEYCILLGTKSCWYIW